MKQNNQAFDLDAADVDSDDPRERIRRVTRALEVAERRQDGRATTLGPRAEKTRQRLIASASRLFVEKGYLGTSVSEIAEDAEVSLATFYQYFGERNDIVAVLVVDIVKEMLERGVDRWDPRTGRMGLRRLVAPYVDGYREHRDFFELWQCVKHVDERLRGLFRDFHGAYQQRFAGFIQEGVDLGLIRSDLDPGGMARAMTLMMESYCYNVFILDPPPGGVDTTEVADLITTLWADAIGLLESEQRSRVATPPT